MTNVHAVTISVAFLGLWACAAAPPRDEAADVRAIENIYVTGPAAVARGDVDAYLAILDDSVALVFPGAPPTKGKSAVRAMLEGMFANGTHSATLAARHIGVADSLAFAEYTGVFVSRSQQGDSTVGHLRYLDILRRQTDGSWKLLRHTAQPDPSP